MNTTSGAVTLETYPRAVGRRTEFLLKKFRAIQNEDHYQELLANGKRKLILRYLNGPKELIIDSNINVKGMKFTQNKLDGDEDNQSAIPDENLPDPLTIDCDIVIKSIGYKTMSIAGVPFNSRKHTIPHEHGCVIDPQNNNAVVPGLYVAGWAKRGPVGIIDATLRDSKDTFGIIKHHLETDQLLERKTSIDEIVSILPKSHVNYQRWLDIDQVEEDRGKALNKVREKILDR